ncbi:Uncharacterised protein [Mycobacteroides abscessus subsp. abscessus]|nr:Uncharacterised protein [Mycobacteroides abscessus subsp. abscessus]
MAAGCTLDEGSAVAVAGVMTPSATDNAPITDRIPSPSPPRIGPPIPVY